MVLKQCSTAKSRTFALVYGMTWLNLLVSIVDSAFGVQRIYQQDKNTQSEQAPTRNFQKATLSSRVVLCIPVGSNTMACNADVGDFERSQHDTNHHFNVGALEKVVMGCAFFGRPRREGSPVGVKYHALPQSAVDAAVVVAHRPWGQTSSSCERQ
jgi:hypothetical protein